MNRLSSKEAHTRFGLHSNIPKCCVRSWVNGEPRDILRQKVGYVQCSKCAQSGYFQQIHRCDESCTPWLSKNVPWFNKDEWFGPDSIRMRVKRRLVEAL